MRRTAGVALDRARPRDALLQMNVVYQGNRTLSEPPSLQPSARTSQSAPPGTPPESLRVHHAGGEERKGSWGRRTGRPGRTRKKVALRTMSPDATTFASRDASMAASGEVTKEESHGPRRCRMWRRRHLGRLSTRSSRQCRPCSRPSRHGSNCPRLTCCACSSRAPPGLQLGRTLGHPSPRTPRRHHR